MNTLIKRIIFESKQTFIVFSIIFSLIFILYLGISIGDFELVVAFMILTYVSIGVAFVSSMIRYSFLLNQKKSIFELQGITNKKYNHLIVILSEVFAYLILDMIILIIFYTFNLELLIKQEDFGSFYLLHNIYNLLFFKYLITVAVYTLFNISYSFKQYFTTIAGAILCTVYLFELATTHILFNILFIIIMLILNLYIYQIKMKQHNKTTLELISYAFIMVFVFLFIKDFVFVPIVEYARFHFIDLGKYTINILPIIAVIVWTIFISKSLYNKFFAPKVIIIGLIIPFLVASAFIKIIDYNQIQTSQVYFDDEYDNDIAIRGFNDNYNYPDGSLNLHLLEKNTRIQILDSLEEQALFQYNKDIYDYNYNYMIENDLVYLSYYRSNEPYSIAIKRDKFEKILEAVGIKKIFFFIEFNDLAQKDDNVILNDELKDYENIIKNSLDNNESIYQLIYDNDLFNQLSLEQSKRHLPSYNSDGDLKDSFFKQSIYLFDNQNIGEEWQFVGDNKEISNSFNKGGE